MKINTLKEIEGKFWFGNNIEQITWRSIIEHLKLIQETDLSYPIILSAEGQVMDGMHRVAKALLEGRETIEAVQFDEDPKPDYEDVLPEDLPY